MKNSINNIVVASAVTLFAANVNADDVQSVINQQFNTQSSSVQQSVTEPRVTIQDYIDVAREAEKGANQTASINPGISAVRNRP